MSDGIDQWLDHQPPEAYSSRGGIVVRLPYLYMERETEKAWLVCLEKGKREVWLPKSQAVLNRDEKYFLTPLWMVWKKKEEQEVEG